MYFRPAILALFTALIFASGAGCQKSGTNAPSAPPTVLSPDTIAHIHWLGKKRLGITAGAYYFMRIWQQPPSSQLERQTLNKLATMPGQWLPGGTNLTDDAVERLWLLLDDVLQEESYVEIRQPAGETAETVFAIRLNEAQTDQWLTNLPAVLEPLTGARAVATQDGHGWSLTKSNVPNLIQLTRVGEWTVIGMAQDKNPLLDEITARIRRDGVPFVSSGTNLWLEAGLDFQQVANYFSLSASPTGGEGRDEVENSPTLNPQFSSINRLNLTVSGDGGNVIMRGWLTFSKPLPAQLEPWQIPINLMHEPLTGFTAIRGIQPLLSDWNAWRDLQIGTPPDQLFFWSLAGSPYQMYFAAPFPDAGQQVSALTDRLLQKANPWLAANGYISFDRASDSNGVTWGDLPDIKPFIKSAGDGSESWLYAGLLPDTNTDAAPPPAGMIQDILRRTNLVYYDWEVTGPRLQPDLQLGQTARQIARRPQMPLDSAGLDWLAMLIPRLGTSATIITRTAPDQLTFVRRSTIGLTAPELHLFADWLESPQFPRGLHSTQ
jgi:hypothetical protein